MLDIDKMTKDEKSLLLYFEFCCTDRSGFVESQRMNDEDFAIAKVWGEEKFIQFGRVFGEFLLDRRRHPRPERDHWVRLSPDAHKIALELRRQRALRDTPMADDTEPEHLLPIIERCNGLKSREQIGWSK